MKTVMSQCTYRCVVLPDQQGGNHEHRFCPRLNAPTGAWCSLTCITPPLMLLAWVCLNAPTGAWCSLTLTPWEVNARFYVSMHLQVRGAP